MMIDKNPIDKNPIMEIQIYRNNLKVRIIQE